MENRKLKKIGDIGVDSGTILIIDPCYLKYFFNIPDKEMKQFMDMIHEATKNPDRGGNTGNRTIDGVAVFTGDGGFDVYVEKGVAGKGERKWEYIKSIVIDTNPFVE